MINKKELLQAFKADLKSAETLQKEWLGKRDTWINESYGNKYGNEEKGKSEIVSKDIKKQLEWLIPSITDPFLSTPDVIKCNPVTFEDSHSARQNELLLNTQFARKFPRYNFINKAARVLAVEGTVVVQTGWEYEDEEVETEAETVVVDGYGYESIEMTSITETVVRKNQPTATVCRNEDIFVDPTAMDNLDNIQFVIHRYESDLSTLESDGRYKNLKKVASAEHSSDDTDFDAEDTTEFRFNDKARKKILVHEYWGNYDVNNDGIVEQIVCAWVGDVIIRLETNPYPDKKPPFIIVPFNAIPFQLFGEALAENIGDNQKVKTAITRGLIDNMARSNNGQIGLRRGGLDTANRKKFLSGKNFEFNGSPADIWQGSYNQLPGSVFDMLQLMNNEIESQTGVKSFSGGITGNALGSTATGARGALDATATRRLHLVRNVAENLMKPLMRKWMSYNSEFLEEEEVVRVTNEEYVPIRKDDLDGRIDIDITISTAEDNAAKAQELSFMLQTMGQSLPQEVTTMLMVEHLRLTRQPEAAKKLENYKPEPDPMMEQMKQIELERAMLDNELLKAQIKDEYSRAAENQVDVRKKTAEAILKEQQARLAGEKADLEGLRFIKEDEEIDARRSAAEKELDRQHQREMAAFQASQGDTNIGLQR